MKPFLLLPLLAVAFTARAQFYEPKTNAEDAVQRVFPVEAARVLAWQRGFAGEITWTLIRSGPGGSIWKIGWKDASGKVVRERPVETGPARLAEGAAYYRDILKQLAGDDWAVPSAPPDNAASAFWQGADLAGPHRRDGLAAIVKLLTDKPKIERASDSARLAGALVHASTPTFARKGALDPVLLARGAAWLAIAEMRLREPIEVAWAPILFLAGRELEASELWDSPTAKTRLRSGAEKFWNLALTEPRVEAVFAFAARPENRTWALPAMYLSIRRDARLQTPAAELATGTSDYPLGALEKTSSQDVTALAAQFPSATGLVPVAVATREEIATGFPAPMIEASGKAPPRLAELTDEAIAQLVQNARTTASQPAPSSTTGTLPPPDFKDADKAWAYVRGLDEPPKNPDSPEDRMRRVRLWLAERRAAAERFRTAFPADARRWDAAIIAYESAQQLAEIGERDAKPPSAHVLDEVLAAPDAGAEAKGDAAFFKAMRLGDDASPSYPHTMPPFQNALADFIDTYPQHRRVREAASIQLQIIGSLRTPGADNFLKKLAAHPNEQIAAPARSMIDLRARTAELKTKPLDLKFTAIDGREVDVAKLRGKVLLIDFWASWCGPCMSDAPHVVATYEKLRERGFEIVGINLDEHKGLMDSAIRRTRMTWPHHHDGKGWQNEFAQRFGIRSIPATWLFDKQGKLREMGLRGQDLEARVENLLRE